MPDLQTAIWDGPFDGEMPDGRTLTRGEEYQVTARDLESGWWKPAAAEKPAEQPKAPAIVSFTPPDRDRSED